MAARTSATANFAMATLQKNTYSEYIIIVMVKIGYVIVIQFLSICVALISPAQNNNEWLGVTVTVHCQFTFIHHNYSLKC